MIALEPITSRSVMLFREIRLRALCDAPSAFGSTYAKEAQLSDAEWLHRTERWNGHSGIGFLAMDGSVGCGIAGSFLDDRDAAQAHLISMWTAPTYRRQGVGRLLVETIGDWARERGAQALLLMVTSSNHSAMKFYSRLGFSQTGRTEPYPNDSALVEYEMVKSLH
jgi:ribosomal protein S18 acetylase RimI-like enzyme